MVLFNEEGEKFACEQCIKGHRVSSCQHGDRPLQHVNKKGRPVSQCTHCRGLRKSRATHTRCQCGDNKTAVAGNDRSCGCHSGNKCTCALKKETAGLDDIKKMASMNAVHKRTPSKPTITTRRSEGSVSKASGARYHHNSEQAWPYPVRSTMAHMAQRSVDSLPLDSFATVSHAQPAHTPSGLTITPPRHARTMSYDSFASPASASVHSPTYSYMNSSPLPPQRWSPSDPSNVAYSNLSTPLWSLPSATSTGGEQSPFSWSEWDFSRSRNHANLAEQYPHTPSVGSTDHSHSSQPALSSPSKSRTASESGDYSGSSGDADFGYANGALPNSSALDQSWTFPNYADPESNSRLNRGPVQFTGSELTSPQAAYGFSKFDGYLNDFTTGKGIATKEPVIANLDGAPDFPNQHLYESSDSVDPMTIHTFGDASSAGWNPDPIWTNYPYHANTQNLARPVFQGDLSGMGNNAQPVWS